MCYLMKVSSIIPPPPMEAQMDVLRVGINLFCLWRSQSLTCSLFLFLLLVYRSFQVSVLSVSRACGGGLLCVICTVALTTQGEERSAT